jgi:pyruvate/2-oxoglutarate dehydrogenase complex dihydrolipoamide acyltransferase (E2) component
MIFQEEERQDIEVTVSTPKLLGIFLAVVLLCGLSLGVGYTLGRNSAKPAATATASPAAPAPNPANKPGAGTTAPAAAPATAPAPTAATPAAPAPSSATATPADASGSSSANGLTFYQAVQQKGTHAQLALPQAAPAKPAAEPQKTLGAGYTVQIAAVSNQEEARRLRERLMAEQYPVVVTQPGDKLFHVLVGPYPEIHEAELIRARLVSAGWDKAFLKR